MLLELRIANFALAADIVLPLQPGLTMLTGETGAGKSLVAGALALLAGGAADRGQIREGEGEAVIEAVFDLAERPDLAAEARRLGLRLGEDEILVLRRELRREGRSRVLVNGLLSSLAVLERFGPRLVSVQSQDQSRELGAAGFARDLIDAVLELEEPRRMVAEHLAARDAAQQELDRREQEAALAREQLEIWRYQHDELAAARLEPDEEGRLAEALAVKRHAHELQAAAGLALARLEEGPAPVREGLGAAEAALAPLAGRSERVARAAESLTAAADLAAEAATELRRFLDGLDLDPRGLDELEERKALYEELRRKYRRDVAGLLALQEQLSQRLERQASEADDLAGLAALRDGAQAALDEAAEALSAARREGAPRIAAAAEAVIRPLALPDLELACEVTSGQPVTAHGADRVVLLARTNPGERRGPVADLASGGERCRIHLGLTVMRAERSGERPVLRLFDEVDAGLGMDAAQPVARLLLRLAAEGQVLCISHLPTMAVAGRQHVRVAKKVTDGRTTLRLREVAGEERVAEIERLLGGEGPAEEDPEARRAYARELLARGSAL